MRVLFSMMLLLSCVVGSIGLAAPPAKKTASLKSGYAYQLDTGDVVAIYSTDPKTGSHNCLLHVVQDIRKMNILSSIFSVAERMQSVPFEGTVRKTDRRRKDTACTANRKRGKDQPSPPWEEGRFCGGRLILGSRLSSIR